MLLHDALHTVIGSIADSAYPFVLQYSYPSSLHQFWHSDLYGSIGRMVFSVRWHSLVLTILSGCCFELLQVTCSLFSRQISQIQILSGKAKYHDWTGPTSPAKYKELHIHPDFHLSFHGLLCILFWSWSVLLQILPASFDNISCYRIWNLFSVLRSRYDVHNMIILPLLSSVLFIFI